MENSSYSSNPHVTLEVREENPYPSHVCAPNFLSFKLSDRDEYGIWKTQMLCLLQSHDMLGFIYGTLVSPYEASSSSSSVSGKEKVVDYQTHHKLWRRSDALVKGWILGSLSKETLGYVLERLTGKHYQEDFSAKNVWDELQTMYLVAVLPQLPPFGEEILRQERVTVMDKISNNGNTTLHVAVGTSKDGKFFEKLLEKIPQNTQLIDVTNSDGSTLLHVAAIIGNTEAADILVEINPDLLLAKDKEGQTPLALALSNMHTETARHLLQHVNTDIQKNALFSGTTSDELLVSVISSKDFCFARELLTYYTTLHSDTVLMAIAQNFPKLNRFLKYIDTTFYIEGSYERFEMVYKSYKASSQRQLGTVLEPYLRILMMLERVRNHKDAMKLLVDVITLIREKNHPSSYHQYYTNPILEATRQDAHELVEVIVFWFPNAILSATEGGHNIIQYAVINRSGKVYNLLYQMNEHRNIYRTMKDSSGNNLLHLAARLAPSNKLKLFPGAASQIQRELQWFEVVKRFICPLSITQKNSLNETPQTIFTREHKELMIEAEKWMKSTVKSYTITAALIITIMFAAGITVPGGSNQETGIPIFTNNIAFTVFAISDAISLSAAFTSMLIFLSIITAPFSEKGFLQELPLKLRIGLSTLFISTTAMMVAFGATLYLVFGQRNKWILIPIAVLAYEPIDSFVNLQFPVMLDFISTARGYQGIL
ncbi:ankyrin repeat-containing protein NPR4 isoform X2 [Lactuca sativa]|uniref:ankyrin repeat-containing protein NPR4 isoform X2 n=1 Tax=Lactuca sativa TaxID=4236 RepID=UPI001C68A60C|nr:ankyrin repeat-containing protein NPR4 isoform X2 [Lactuca sativa]